MLTCDLEFKKDQQYIDFKGPYATIGVELQLAFKADEDKRPARGLKIYDN